MIGITIITGFLGSGKTTLLKNLLKESLKKEKKIAIIHNEFTENNNNIDKIVFKDINDIYNFPKANKAERGSKDEAKRDSTNVQKVDDTTEENDLTIVNRIENDEGYIYELNNGCLCCSNKSNFVKLIENILSMKSSYDYIFVEVAGVYDNIQLNNLLWLDELNKSKIYLDSIVYVLDAYNFLKSFQRDDFFPYQYGTLARDKAEFNFTEVKQNLHCEESESRIEKERSEINSKDKHNEDIQRVGENPTNEQLIVCDIVIINKIDKITDQDKEKLKCFVKNMNPLSYIYPTSYAKIPIENLTNLKCYEKKNIKNMLTKQMNYQNESHKNVFHYSDFVNFSLHFNHSIPDLINLSKQLNKMKKEFIQSKNKDVIKNIFSFKKKNIFSFKKINNTLVTLLWSKNLEIYRGKGVFVAFNDDIYSYKNKLKLNIYYYQSVGDLYEINLVKSDIHEFFQTDTNYQKPKVHNYECSDLEKDTHIIQDAQRTDHKDWEDEISDVEYYLSDSSSCSDKSSSSGGSDDYNLNNILNGSDVFTSRFLFIGKHIDVENIRSKLNDCLCD
ncbi:COBW domain-containing protein 1 [Plasmodium gonderi]|uniref:COBW domain-containing protein 1 n=1 Tax=Plasmodium gonderi TaxID=77519 RepID=A0A1Y1JKV6_PLAGO|nr:COBW domain-containing protein 1 [Plasmodium gonderi]GAW83159.1 COBW domain-containing protein 1 [Plasmodium gonderi]